MVKNIIVLLWVFLWLPIYAVAEVEYQAGKDYVELAEAVHVSDPSKIEIAEVFWYGCGHCFHFEPVIEKWKAELGADVVLVRSPAMWNEKMEIHARAFYTAEVLGVLDKLHGPIFDAMHKEHKQLATEQELSDFFAKYDVKPEDFKKAFNSFGVTSSVKQADARARSYKITGTPEIVVAGKYRISARSAGGQEAMLKVVDYLIQKERAARKSAS